MRASCSTIGLIVGGGDAALAVAAQPAGRLLGHLLAAADPGRRHVAAVRAADDGLDGCDSARADGQRHQPLQPDAQHRRQHRHRRRPARCWRATSRRRPSLLGANVTRLRSGVAVDVRADAGGVHGRRRRRRHRDQPRLRRALRHGPAAGDDGVVRRPVPAARRPVPRAGAAGPADEAAARAAAPAGGGALRH